MDVLEAGPSEPGGRRGIRAVALLGIGLLVIAIGLAAARWWSVQVARPDRLAVVAVEAIGPFAIAGDDLPDGWPEDLVAPALLLRIEITGDPQRTTRVRPTGETARYATAQSPETMIPAGERLVVDLRVTPADCGPAADAGASSPLVDEYGGAVPMTSAALQSLVTALDALCTTGGESPIISTRGARIDVFLRDRILIMRLRVTTATDRVVLQPRDSIGFRGVGEVEATMEDGTASARPRWLITPAELVGLESPTVRVRAFAVTGGRGYPWVLDLRVPGSLAAVAPSSERNDGVDLAEVAPGPSR